MSPVRKIKKMNEAAWLFGILFCAVGVSLSAKADFGLSMVAAPAYILHLKLSAFLPWFTHGTSEYVWQFLLLILTCLIVRRFRVKYLFSFVTSFLFGITLDGWYLLIGGNAPFETMPARIAAFAGGLICTAFAIAFFFRTGLPLEIYELTVSEIAKRYKLPTDRVKFWYDVAMLLTSLLFAFVLMHGFEGVGIGTVITTLINAPLIALCGKILDRFFTFEPRFPRLVEKLGN